MFEYGKKVMCAEKKENRFLFSNKGMGDFQIAQTVSKLVIEKWNKYHTVFYDREDSVGA